MISFEYRILSEFKIKKAKIDTLSNFILGHTDPKESEAKEASVFLDVMIDEIDKFYVSHSEILSNNDKKPHHSSRLPETKRWRIKIWKVFMKKIHEDLENK